MAQHMQCVPARPSFPLPSPLEGLETRLGERLLGVLYFCRFVQPRILVEWNVGCDLNWLQPVLLVVLMFAERTPSTMSPS